jgi:hypothetical protein
VRSHARTSEEKDWIVTDFLDEKRREIAVRLNELGPLVEEYNRLAAAASALDGIGGSTATVAVSAATPVTTAPVRRGPGRPPGSASKAAPAVAAVSAPAKKRGRPPGRKKVGRPPGKKVGRPAGKKVGRPAGKKVGRPPGKKVGRPAGSTSKAAAATATAPAAGRRRAGRRKGSGTRSVQALEFVQGQPGITIPELAAKMDIKQNYLYRVLPALEQEGKIRKQGRGWHPKG